MNGSRLLVASISTLLACCLGWWILQSRAAPPVEISNRDPNLDALLVKREQIFSMVTGRGPFVLEPIDESTARALFVMHKDDFQYLPQRYYGYNPGLRHPIDWEEHPQGRWNRVTNAAGLRQNDDDDLIGADLAILATGDSHTDGVCNNAEGFPALLEAGLAEHDDQRSVVAINTGVVGYSFYNYLGALEEYLPQQPDVFVIAVYGGNDFLEVLRPHHYFRGTLIPPTRPGYWERIQAAKRVSSSALAQGLNQVLYFQEHPEQVDVAQEATSVLMRRIRERCEEQGVRLVVAYIPPAFEAPWPELEQMQSRAEEMLDLSPADFDVANIMARHLFEELDQLGVTSIDMGPLYRAESELCYWKRDLHINVLGHRLIADAVEEALVSGKGGLEPLQLEAPVDGKYAKYADDGSVELRGEYLDGFQHGEWTYFHANGKQRARGEWKVGERQGDWRWWYADGKDQKRGSYVDGQEEGEWEEWYPDGGPRLTNVWSDGVPEGRWQQWHPDGKPSSDGERKAGQMDGKWTTWYPGGQMEQRLTYDNGQPKGKGRRWHETGVLAWEGRFENGLREGEFTYWDKAGRKKSEGEFHAGERHGPSSFWTPEGELDKKRSGDYQEGVLEGNSSP
ncbi:MAG: antitoxin component YwqK of YwqJK toxin-antitoxin module/lysophospholipase L1-like esterase [Planctomycetota bacterium]|jgi:antitoxin component YwqK of YwqJK toxin-antitoxin module/lysophospholipase L1-like esterase